MVTRALILGTAVGLAAGLLVNGTWLVVLAVLTAMDEG